MRRPLPETLDYVARFAKEPGPFDLEEARAELRSRCAAAGPGPDIRSVHDELLPSGPRVRLYEAADRPHGVLLWFHGGGWAFCDLDTHDLLCRQLAVASGATVVAVDYRLAPEHPYPAAADDCHAAATWARAIDSRVVVGGDSAGGQLAAVVSRRLTDEGSPPLAQVLVYPALDPTLAGDSHGEHRGRGTEPGSMRWMWQSYAGATPLGHPELDVLRSRHDGMPPTLVVNAELDALRDDGVDYVAALRAHGVAAVYTEYPGVIHTFFHLGPEFGPWAEAAAMQAGTFARAHLEASLRRAAGAAGR